MNIDRIIDFLESNSVNIAHATIHPRVIFFNALFLLLLYFIRFELYIYIAKKKNGRNQMRNITPILIINCVICYLCAFVISLVFIALSGGTDNLISSCVLFPIIGFILSLWVESNLLIENLTKYGFDIDQIFGNKSIIKALNNKNNQESDEENTDNNSNEMITENDMNEYKPDDLFRNAINTLKNNVDGHTDILNEQSAQLAQQSKKIEKQSEILNIQSASIEAMKNTMMTDKKFKLKTMIYKCLDQGFVTPDQNEVIVADYKNYRALDGNSEIKELYEKRYLNLHVHEDRRKQQIPVDNDRRKNILELENKNIYFEEINND